MARIVDDDPPIRTHPASQEYRDNWDRIFGGPEEKPAGPDAFECKLKLYPPEDQCDVCAAPAELVEYADLVTEMTLVKHPYQEQGIRAQAGIEF